MPQLIDVLIPVGLLAFWAWMFSAMTGNENLPNCFITITNGNDPRTDWTLAFIFLNFVAAVFYYVNVYRSKGT